MEGCFLPVLCPGPFSQIGDTNYNCFILHVFTPVCVLNLQQRGECVKSKIQLVGERNTCQDTKVISVSQVAHERFFLSLEVKKK